TPLLPGGLAATVAWPGAPERYAIPPWRSPKRPCATRPATKPPRGSRHARGVHDGRSRPSAEAARLRAARQRAGAPRSLLPTERPEDRPTPHSGTLRRPT